MKTSENSESQNSEKNKNFSLSVSVPKRSIYSFLGFIGMLTLTILEAKFYIFPGFKEIFSTENFALSSIGLLHIPIISYCLIGINVVLIANIFKPLKPYSQNGLKKFFIGAFIFLLGAGLLFGFGGMIVGIIVGAFTTSMMHGLINGLIVGATLAVTGLLVVGLDIEYENKK